MQRNLLIDCTCAAKRHNFFEKVIKFGSSLGSTPTQSVSVWRPVDETQQSADLFKKLHFVTLDATRNYMYILNIVNYKLNNLGNWTVKPIWTIFLLKEVNITLLCLLSCDLSHFNTTSPNVLQQQTIQTFVSKL